MPAKTRIQPIDATKAFSLQGAERIEALRSQVLGRLSAVLRTATEDAADTFGFDVTHGSDDIAEVSESEAVAWLRPSEGDYPALRSTNHPAFMIGMVANEESVGMVFRVAGAAEWRLFIKAVYQHRELLGDYLAEFEELVIDNGDGDEEAVEELDQIFAVDVESEAFKKMGAVLYFPGLEYAVETEEDFETFSGDFAALFPLYWTLLKSARGESVDMDELLNG